MVSISKYQPVDRATHLSITLILQCSAQDCKSCNAKLQDLLQLPISQTVKNAWIHDSWDHGFKSYFTLFSTSIVAIYNFGDKSNLSVNASINTEYKPNWIHPAIYTFVYNKIFQLILAFK